MSHREFDRKYWYTRLTITGVEPYEPIPLSTRSVLLEAEQHQVRWEEAPDSRLIKLQYQDHVEFFYSQVPSGTTSLASFATTNKRSTKALLKNHGISVPKGYYVTAQDTEDYFLDIFEQLTHPLVVKPFDASQGRGVSVGISSHKAYLKAITKAFKYSSSFSKAALVEEMFDGREYRILATQNKIIGITQRVPANVVGDGKRSIQELVDKKNTDSRRGDDFIKTGLKNIVIDDEVRIHLEKQGLTLDTIPDQGVKVLLRLNSNLSTGGDSIDLTDTAHPSVNEIALQVMRALPGLQWGGIDLMSKDIYAPQTSDMYCVVEVNDSPGFFMHDFPYEGENRHAARELLYLMFPELRK